MSKQAFDKLMGQLPAKDREAIYATAAAYGLDFDSPEWIPFAISQHGLIAIQHGIEDLGAAVRTGSDHAIREAMRAIRGAKDAEASILQQAAAALGSGLEKTAAESRQSLEVEAVKLTAQLTDKLTRALQATAADIIARQVGPLNVAADKTGAAAQQVKQAAASLGIKALVFAAAMVGVVAMAAWGFVAWERHEVDDLAAQQAALQAQIVQEQAAVADLDQRGGRIKMSTCGPEHRLCVELAPNQGGGLPVPYSGPWQSDNKHQYAIPDGY